MKARFNLRAVAVVLDNGRVLVHRSEKDPFWSLPGGRIEPGETSAATVERELREELGAEAGVGRLLWVVEEFFTYEGTSVHELGFYYRVELPPDLRRREAFAGRETGDLDLIFRWQPLDALDAITLLPAFLREKLRHLPAAVEHIVHRG